MWKRSEFILILALIFRLETLCNSLPLGYSSSLGWWVQQFSKSWDCVSKSINLLHLIWVSLSMILWLTKTGNYRKDFADYADICFREFGDRVKHWITFNEPNIFSQGGYAKGNAPNRCSAWQELNCTTGDSSTEPYLVGHNLIKSHAAAVKLYKAKYQV